MKDMLAPSIEAIEYALQEQENKLAYIYFGNFIGSEWVNTVCPDCGKVLVERINLGGCGAKSLACHLQGDCCPSAGGGCVCWVNGHHGIREVPRWKK